MRTIIVVLLSMMITGCEYFKNEQSVPNEFIGEWEWTSTHGGWGPNADADSVDYTMSLIIYSQNEAKWLRNDSLLNRYVIRKGNEDWTKGKWVMYQSKKEEDVCGFILEYAPESKELSLPSANCTDVPTHFFSKPGN